MRVQHEASNKTALYMRLSKDDDKQGESASISTQRTILHEYANAHGLVVVGEYVDDGYSGTNLERPDFKRMMRDIESGKINCVLTKDLSRLGRNSARTSDLLDEEFPRYGVRYISVIDGFDSDNQTSGTAMTASFMGMMNEMYARDISNKIKTSVHAKMQRGECVASFAHFGYKKDTENGNPNRLVVDTVAAPVVKEIFQMAAEGCSPGEIARRFNEKGVVTPAVYRCLSRPYLNIENYSQRKEWTSSMVCKMLRNEVYLGKTVQGKTKKLSFKSKETKTIPRDDWIVVEGTHEALISEETYRIVRERCVSRRSPANSNFVNVFSGIARCADCGKNMTTVATRKKNAVYNLCCGGYKAYGAGECSNHFIDYNFLYNTILEEIRGWLSLSAEDKESLAKELAQEDEKRKLATNNSLERSLSEMEKEKKTTYSLTKKLFEEYASGRVAQLVYENMIMEYKDKIQSLEKAISEMTKQLRPEETKSESYRKFFAVLDEVSDVRELTKPLLQKLIDHIEVEQGEYEKNEKGVKVKKQKIRIFYRFIGEIGN